MTPDLAEEILRENGYASEADEFLAKISSSDAAQASELILSLKQRAIRVLIIEKAQERADASWNRLAS